MRITHLARFASPGFIEYERVERSGDERGSYKKYIYRRRLVDGTVYKRGERYGLMTVWGNESTDRIIALCLQNEFREKSIMARLLRDVQ